MRGFQVGDILPGIRFQPVAGSDLARHSDIIDRPSRVEHTQMIKVSMDRVHMYYHSHRRENFAASQRLEGIVSTVTERGNQAPLPNKEELRKKYAVKHT